MNVSQNGPQNIGQILTLSNIALCEFKRHDFDSALRNARQCLAVAVASEVNGPTAIASAIVSLSHACLGEGPEAKREANHALELLDVVQDPRLKPFREMLSEIVDMVKEAKPPKGTRTEFEMIMNEIERLKSLGHFEKSHQLLHGAVQKHNWTFSELAVIEGTRGNLLQNWGRLS